MYYFKDSFADNTNNWQTQKTGVTLKAGEGLTITHEGGVGFTSAYNQCEIENGQHFRIEMIVKPLEVNSDSSVGIAWNAKTSEDQFEFRFTQYGMFTVGKKVDGVWKAFADWDFCRHLKLGSQQANELAVEVTTDTHTCYANGQKVIEFEGESDLMPQKFGPLTYNGATLQIKSVSIRSIGKQVLQSVSNSNQITSETSNIVEEGSPTNSHLGDLDSSKERLDSLVGLEGIKTQLRDLIFFLELQKIRNRFHLPTSSMGSHMVFIGVPGSGKSSVAQLIGNIFQNAGVLRKGHVVEISRSNLVAKYLGQTSNKLLEAIERASDGVLVINDLDEATGEMAEEIASTLCNAMDKRKNLRVVLTGRATEMENFLSTHSELKSKFSLFFEFGHYSPTELVQIFLQFCTAEEYKLDVGTEPLVENNLTRAFDKKDKNFTNGNYVRSLFEETLKNQARRLSLADSIEKQDAVTLRPEDVPTKLILNRRGSHAQAGSNSETTASAMEKIDELIGLEDLKEELQSLTNFMKVQKYFQKYNADVDPFTYHMVFYGPPGTGKTTVARLLGEIYYDLGILSKGHVVETDRAGLVANFIGQSATKTDEKIQEAIGGILFIDEAYSLRPPGPWQNDFGNEVIQTLLKRMEDYREDFIVIAAGYKDEMDRFIEANPGLRSRFSRYLTFSDFTTPELLEIYKLIVNESGYSLSPSGQAAVQQHLAKAHAERTKSFGNGRYVRKLFEKTCELQANRVVEADNYSEEMVLTLQGEDVPCEILDGEKSEEAESTNLDFDNNSMYL